MNPTAIVTVIITAILLIIMALNVPQEEPERNIELYSKQHFIVEVMNSLNPLSSGLTAGLLCLVLCWTVNYFNWLHVGDFPSTPLSPNSRAQRYRRPLDIMDPSGITGSSAELAYFTPILVSLGVAGITVWNSLGG